ncbi:MAG: peptide chain release factor N(5)-glutamine methyltransferase [Rubrobacteraceae bacterium]
MQVGTTGARQVAREAARELENAGVPESAASAEVLLSEVLGVGRADLSFYGKPLTEDQTEKYQAFIRRRKQREPVQRILGYAYFRNLKLEVNGETLIPRSDTESVVEAALELIDSRGGSCRVLDLGTGSGAIAISIAQERPSCEVLATDISEAALEVARCNACREGVNVDFRLSDVAEDLERSIGKVDILVSNPPYIETADIEKLPPEVLCWDPISALDGGHDGLAFYRRIFDEAPAVLGNGSDVVLEVGDGQAEEVLDLGGRAGFIPLGSRPDLSGTPRAALLSLRW